MRERSSVGLALARKIALACCRALVSSRCQLRYGGTSIVLVEQNVRAALAIADRSYVLESGRITLERSARDLACDPRVAAIYIGTHGGSTVAAR
ncbi:hypothetical protein [Xanthobacter sp. VNH20]|uniref:hypothetical protein n=1 Tax=Xanthobacter sp. VNH20 TaxID=3156616 RepID=UPI0032B35A2C